MNQPPFPLPQTGIQTLDITGRQSDQRAGFRMGADLLQIQVRGAEVLHHVPQTDDIEETASTILIQEISVERLQAELLPRKLDRLLADIDPCDTVEGVTGEVEEEAVSAADLEQGSTSVRVEKPLQDLQTKAEIPCMSSSVGQVVAVFGAKEVVLAVQVEELLVAELRIRKDQCTASATDDSRAIRIEPAAAAKSTSRVHEP